MTEAGRWRRLTAGVRFRTTVSAIVVVGVVLTAGVTVLAVQQRASLRASITQAAETRAADLAALVEAGAVTDPLPQSSGTLVGQVLAPDGSVMAASAGLGTLPPFTAERPAPGAMARDTVLDLLEPVEDADGFLEDESPYRVVALGVDTPGGTGWVMVAASLEPAEKAAGVLRPLLLAGLPVVLALVGIAVWGLTGSALRPVESMRREAETISAREIERRLPVPVSQDEVHRLAVTLNAMLDRLEAAAAEQRRFVADASHELKSPVAAMRTMLEVAADDPGFSQWRKLIADLTREDLRLEHLVTDLLTLARADEGAAREVVEVDLDQIVGKAAEDAAALHDVRVDTSGLGPVRISGDPHGLDRLFRNLLDNAARHAQRSVAVASTYRDGTVSVTVADDGPGIPAADRERVFERFVRLDESRARTAGGTGLGLAVARAVAHRHGAEVTVRDSPLGGAAFEVVFPRPS